MKKTILLSLLTIAFIVLQGCTTIKYNAATVDAILSMNQNTEGYEVIGQFVHKPRGIFIILGLITLKDSDMEKAVNEALKTSGGDGVTNIKIEEAYNIVDFALSFVESFFIGFNVFQTRSIIVKGDIVKLKDKNTDLPKFDDLLNMAMIQFNRSQASRHAYNDFSRQELAN